ncbi:MAG: hypothetical protein AAGA58_14780 [Verrucomicrobiota bacterium]
MSTLFALPVSILLLATFSLAESETKESKNAEESSALFESDEEGSATAEVSESLTMMAKAFRAIFGDNDVKSRVGERLANEYLERGHLREAVEIANEVSDYRQALINCDIATAAFKAGESEVFESSVRNATEFSRFKLPWEGERIRARLSAVYTAAGNEKKSKELFDSLKKPRERLYAEAWIAREKALRGEEWSMESEAEEAAKQSMLQSLNPDLLRVSEALIDISRNLVETGGEQNADKALKLLEQAEEFAVRSRVSTMLIALKTTQVRWQAGLKEETEPYFSKLEDAMEKTTPSADWTYEWMLELYTGAVDRGDTAMAGRGVRNLERFAVGSLSMHQPNVLSAKARVQYKLGEKDSAIETWKRALEIANENPNHRNRVRTCFRIALDHHEEGIQFAKELKKAWETTLEEALALYKESS